MQVTEQNMREQLAEELADLVLRQKVIVECNDALGLLTNYKVDDTFKSMAEDDNKNLHMMEAVLINFGVVADAKESTARISAALAGAIVDSGSGPIEKLSAYINLKQNQIMTCHLLHKASQIVQEDVRIALAPMDGVYASFTQQMLALNAFLESSGVEWLTGQKAKTGLFGRVRDAMATVAGTIMSRTAKPADEMDVIPVLESDHRKVEALFAEIEDAKDRNQAVALFTQLKADLTVHSIAEEEIVYRRYSDAQGMEELIEDGQQEHEDIRMLLDEVSDSSGNMQNFHKKIQELKALVNHHVRDEESEMFDHLRSVSTEEERVKLSGEFMRTKAKIQENLGSSKFVASAKRGQKDASSTLS